MAKLTFSCIFVAFAIIFCFNGIINPYKGWQEFSVLMLFSIGAGKLGELIYETFFE